MLCCVAACPACLPACVRCVLLVLLKSGGAWSTPIIFMYRNALRAIAVAAACCCLSCMPFAATPLIICSVLLPLYFYSYGYAIVLGTLASLSRHRVQRASRARVACHIATDLFVASSHCKPCLKIPHCHRPILLFLHWMHWQSDTVLITAMHFNQARCARAMRRTS